MTGRVSEAQIEPERTRSGGSSERVARVGACRCEDRDVME
jgi:hypothetical protein